jgi:hypothetical protein
MSNNHVKDPAAILDYAVDWLGGGNGYLARTTPPLTIAASVFTITPVEAGGLVASNETFDASKTTLRISGGVVGHIYQITNRITASNGTTDERSFLIRVENR